MTEKDDGGHKKLIQSGQMPVLLPHIPDSPVLPRGPLRPGGGLRDRGRPHVRVPRSPERDQPAGHHPGVPGEVPQGPVEHHGHAERAVRGQLDGPDRVQTEAVRERGGACREERGIRREGQRGSRAAVVVFRGASLLYYCHYNNR